MILLIKERYYFILRPCLATISLSLIKAQISTPVKLVKLRQNLFPNKLFFQDISQHNKFESSYDYLLKHDGIKYDQ